MWKTHSSHGKSIFDGSNEKQCGDEQGDLQSSYVVLSELTSLAYPEKATIECLKKQR